MEIMRHRVLAGRVDDFLARLLLDLPEYSWWGGEQLSFDSPTGWSGLPVVYGMIILSDNDSSKGSISQAEYELATAIAVRIGDNKVILLAPISPSRPKKGGANKMDATFKFCVERVQSMKSLDFRLLQHIRYACPKART